MKISLVTTIQVELPAKLTISIMSRN